jgi:hypothetical protein
MARCLPELTSIIIHDYRSSLDEDTKTENEIIQALFRINKQLNSIGFKYYRSYYRSEVIWKSASPSLIESSRDKKGNICIWTPEPDNRKRWPFWLETFGEASITWLTMSQRWPGSPQPSLWDLEWFAEYQNAR